MVNFLEIEEPINETRIRELESKLNLNFPTSYRNHLLKFNGGRCKPNVFNFEEEGKKEKSFIDWFLAVHDGEYDNLEDYFNTYKIEEKRMPDAVFPIAHDPGGNLICMDSNDGSIHFWDHEKEVDYNQSDDSDRTNLYFVARNLNDFMSSLE
ncbi:SMI1/KNR4 family protein [Fulvivirgaceae bacterium BMA12]|uniref:SMI1/KNR4 family protein n=1 Tax=Agaribacillus aureus TaxID=3051825 RepID=A0ABT8L8D0_9BACT|nr:SMI1/KNR4 family protein [Fulvivirgaceae bacterium BMA12]